MPGWLASSVNWVVAALLLASLVPYIAPSRKFSELLSHFKLQYVMASILMLSLSWIASEYWSVAGSALALIIQLSAIVPVYFAGRLRKEGGQSLKIALANINHTNSDYARFVSWAKAQPFDILVVQEINEAWANALKELDQQYPFAI